MSGDLLQTKLYVPRLRPLIVPRPHLIKKLNQGIQQGNKLTLISAPAGFGKTTLIAEWGIQRTEMCWLSLDEGDNDTTRFLKYLVAALQTIVPTIGKGVLTMLQSPQLPPTESILTALLNEVTAVSHDIVLVLDDYHVIDAQPIDNVLIYLLEHLPPQMHLVIATREDPNLPLPRLRARNQLTELRVLNLRFTTAESAEFLNQVMGLKLAAEDIVALETRTEGWIAGLQLAALAMQGSLSTPGKIDKTSLIKAFTGSHRFVLDYLIEEVLEQQSESVQRFLLETAVLDRMTGSLCDALTGQNNGQATLELLERSNLFLIPLDDKRQWYRYHHLFIDLLRQRQQQTQPEQLPILQRKASEWLELNGFVDEAIEHSLRAQDFGRAAQQIEDVAETVWANSTETKLRRWLANLPIDLLLAKPQLCVFHTWYLLAGGALDEADRILQAVNLMLNTSNDESHDVNNLTLRGRFATTQAFLAFYRGDGPRVIHYSHQALEYLPEQDLLWRSIAIHLLGDAYDFQGDMVQAYQFRIDAVKASKASGITMLIMIANLKLAITLRHQGQLPQVIEICQQQMELANRSGMAQTDVVGWLLAIWGEVLAEINDLDGAIRKATKGVKLTERGGDLAMQGWSCLCLLRIFYSVGDIASAQEIVYKIEDVAQKSYVPPWIMNLNAAWQARLWLAQGELETASQWVGERGLDAKREPSYWHEKETISLARILIAQGQLNEAVTLLQRQFKLVEEGGRTSRAIEILMLQARIFQAMGDTAQAMTTLEQALTRAEPGGFIRLFVDEGPPMAQLISETAVRGIMPNYTQNLLTAFETEGQKIESKPYLPPSPKPQPLIEPLSQRELEVLQLISQGFSNGEISQRLFIALNTVKGHNRNIFEKLQVHRRTEAVARARALGLL